MIIRDWATTRWNQWITKRIPRAARVTLNQKKLFIKVLVVCILSFSIVMISANNIHIPKSVFDPDTYYIFQRKELAKV